MDRGAALRHAGFALLPALAAALGALGTSSPLEALFRADAAGLAVGIAVAAFAAPPRRAIAARIVAAAVLLAIGHAIVAAARAVPSDGALAIGALSLGTSVGAAGLAALGRRLSCPSVAAGAVAAAVLWTACAGVRWADRLAASVPFERRNEVREAVLRVDPFTAAAYGAAGYERMHATDLYSGTIVATLPLEMPPPFETAACWGALGAVAFAAASVRGAVRLTRSPSAVAS